MEAGTASDRLDEIVRDTQGELLLDLEALEFLSSAGLRVILRTAKRLERARDLDVEAHRSGAFRRSIKLCGAKGIVSEVLEVSGFGELLEVYDDEESALASF